MHELSALIFFIGWPVIWFYGGRVLHRTSGWHWLLAYVTTGSFGLFAIFGLIFLLGSNKADDTAAGIVSIAIASFIGFCGYQAQKAIDKHREKVDAYTSPKALAELRELSSISGGNTARDRRHQQREPGRAAMVKAESESLHRMALRERDDQIQRLKFENEMLQDQLHSKRKPARHKPKASPKFTGKFGTFEFDYMDSEGNLSHRLVDINAVEEERFSGYCHEARAIRTFRVDNVLSSLVNVETGEVEDALAWTLNLYYDHQYAKKQPQQ